MIYVAQTLPQNAPSQTPDTLNPQTAEPTINQQLTPQDSNASVSLGAQSTAANILNTSSSQGVPLPDVTPQSLTAELDSSVSHNTPPYAALSIVVLFVVIFVLVARKINQ